MFSLQSSLTQPSVSPSVVSVSEQDSPDLMLLLRMLSLGQGAWDMIDSQVFKEPRLVRRVLTCGVRVLRRFRDS